MCLTNIKGSSSLLNEGALVRSECLDANGICIDEDHYRKENVNMKSLLNQSSAQKKGGNTGPFEKETFI